MSQDEDGVGVDARDSGRGEGGVGGFDGAGESDGAGGVLDHQGFETELFAIDGGETDAEVISEATEEGKSRVRPRSGR